MKKIVLLSDGTGNSAAKRHKTNVWRLYQALDLHRDDQVAFYDDGVGTQRFLPVKLLGSAFGWGLQRNVVELYSALCRVYEPGDKIYLFGFSRGAFTVRMLAGLIASQGLVSACGDEGKLRQAAQARFRAYRLEPRKGKKLIRGWLTYPFRLLWHEKRREEERRPPPIEFIGVWDTVAAYGFPIDELNGLWDWLVWPLRFVDQKLPDNVRRACHALAVDDDRLSFRPLLWVEGLGCRQETRSSNKQPETEENCIEQVWFAGAHADVGGGYPAYDLSLVSLDWMISKVEGFPWRNGLHFRRRIRREHRRACDWHGQQHEPRSGLRAYYRYKPREIGRLCNRAGIDRPKIHRSVFERIRVKRVPYAPTGLPGEYEVATTRFLPRSAHYESPNGAAYRARAMDAALDIVFWRRGLYFAFVLANLAALVALVVYGLPEWGWELVRHGWTWAAPTVAGTLTALKIRLPRETETRATKAWFALKGGLAPRFPKSWTGHLRQLLDRRILASVRRVFVPLALFVVGVVLAVGALNRASFALRAHCDLCEASEEPQQLDAERPITFSIDDPCYATGVALRKGESYRFDVEPAKWCDGRATTCPAGDRRPLLLPLALNRRHPTEPWMKLMGRVGTKKGETFAVGAGPLEYKAKSDGELFLYVNDGVIGVAGRNRLAWPYSWRLGPNQGTAKVTVTPLRCCGSEGPD